MRVGVLALQGDFEAHAEALRRASADVDVVEVRKADHLDGLAGLVIPGGESTTMLKLMEYYQLFEPLRHFGAEKPMFGTCAGAILLAREVTNPAQASLGLVDLTVERNGYGRQLDSRVVRLTGQLLGGEPELEAVFIRAPIVRRIGEGVRVLASYNGDPVLLETDQFLIATFHPELSTDPRVHARFLAKLS
jgi:pyridoxal 5'-phosphate synthase pdxT subunit